jgi:FAD/FMN-containing dehydrogenase
MPPDKKKPHKMQTAMAPASPEHEGALIDALRQAIGAANVQTDPAEFATRLVEDRGLYSGTAIAVLRPDSTAEVAACVKLCHGAGVAIVPQGGNTGLVGGGVPNGGIILTTERLNRIRAVDATNGTMIVEAGCILANIQAAADDVNAFFGVVTLTGLRLLVQ